MDGNYGQQIRCMYIFWAHTDTRYVFWFPALDNLVFSTLYFVFGFLFLSLFAFSCFLIWKHAWLSLFFQSVFFFSLNLDGISYAFRFNFPPILYSISIMKCMEESRLVVLLWVWVVSLFFQAPLTCHLIVEDIPCLLEFLGPLLYSPTAVYLPSHKKVILRL